MTRRDVSAACAPAQWEEGPAPRRVLWSHMTPPRPSPPATDRPLLRPSPGRPRPRGRRPPAETEPSFSATGRGHRAAPRPRSARQRNALAAYLTTQFNSYHHLTHKNRTTPSLFWMFQSTHQKNSSMIKYQLHYMCNMKHTALIDEKFKQVPPFILIVNPSR